MINFIKIFHCSASTLNWICSYNVVPPTHPPYVLLVMTAVSPGEQELWKKSFAIFEKGMKDFEAIGDSTNTALLLCNTGRLMRICAQAHCGISAEQNRGEFSPEEALYYNKVPCQALHV